MRARNLLSVLPILQGALAVPHESREQLVLGFEGLVAESEAYTDFSHEIYGEIYHGAERLWGDVVKETKKVAHKAESVVEQWFESGREYIKDHADGIVYEVVTHPEFPEMRIRVTSPKLCDPHVTQYSGYLDIAEDKHLFFWFFESRSMPATDPVLLWLNGGPGCSSSTGLLFELGPCNIVNEGKSTEPNKWSWNNYANTLFLDQPVNVGYSWSDSETVNTTPVAAEDVYAFLELFLNRYPKYSKAPFHIAAESYGGHYAPNIASTVFKKNKALALAPNPRVKHINLASVMIGNGLTEPLTQFASIPEYACNGPYPIFDDPEGPQCQALRSKVPTCQRLIKSCYDYGSRWTCLPAALYCWSQMYGSAQQLGLNLYDVRRKCNRAEDGDLCYKELVWIETFMNNDSVKKELGVNPKLDFASCNMDVNKGFMMQGDSMHDSAALIPELLENGVRVLVYAGNADYMCNAIGNLQWMLNLESPFQDEFNKGPSQPWTALTTGKIAGEVRSAGGNGYSAGNFTYVSVFGAGHMVPSRYDQPEAAADLFVRWITDVPLALTKEELDVMNSPFGGLGPVLN